MKDMMHLARITLANLPKGKLNLTEDEILKAMNEAVAKENDMGYQLIADPKKLEVFAKMLAPMAWDSVHS